MTLPTAVDHVADVLQAPVDALEGGQRALDGRILDPELRRHGDRGQRVAHVVQPRQVHGDLERRRARAARRRSAS